MGGITEVYSKSNHWASDDMRCDLVGGVTIQEDATISTLADFENVGIGNTLLGLDVPITGRGLGWSVANSRFEFSFTNAIDFGTVSNGTQLAGVVCYFRSGTNATSPVYYSQTTPITAGGGNVIWGNPGANVIGFWDNVFNLGDGTQAAFRSTVETLIEDADPFGVAANMGFAMERDTTSATPTGNERFMNEYESQSPTWITGANPGNANMPVHPVTSRLDFAVGSQYTLVRKAANESGPGLQSIWDESILGPPHGENILRLWTFIYPAGAYNAATARIYSIDDFAGVKATQAGENIIYGDNATQRVNNTVINIV